MKFNDAWYIDNINNVNRAAKEIFKIVFLKLNITTENDNAILMNIGKTSKRYIAFSIKNGLDKIPRGTNSPINLLSVDINILLKNTGKQISKILIILQEMGISPLCAC